MKKSNTKIQHKHLLKTQPALFSKRYPDEELTEFKKIILGRLAEASQSVAQLDAAISRHLHDPDDARPTFKLSEDATCVLSKHDLIILNNRLKEFIEQLKLALKRIRNKTYGICWISGELIDAERLKNFPHTIMNTESMKRINSLLLHSS